MTEYIYVDINSGSDETGDGSLQSPYKTLHHFMLNVAIKNRASYEISLNDGEYYFAANTFQLFENSQIKIIGRGEKTALVQSTGIASNTGGVGYNTTTIEFCRLIYKTTIKSDTINCNCFRWNWIMRNVAFVDIPNDRGAGYATLGFMIPNACKLEFHNCIKHKSTIGFLRTTDGTIKVYDSAGPFTSGYGTADSHWNASGNLIKELSFTDSYKVIGNEHPGIYAGDYTWSINKLLILHDGEYKKWTNDIGNTNIIPAMTSDTNGNIVLSTNSTNTFTYFPYKAFDRSIVANSGWANGSGQYPAWLKINLGTSRKVGKYTIVFNFTTRPSCFPKDWEFQGSNDDQNWDILDSQKLSSWTLEEKKEFLIANPKEYKYHRIYVKSGDPTYAVFTEIELFEVGQDPHWSITTVDQIKDQGMDSSSSLLNRVAKELDSIPMNKRE